MRIIHVDIHAGNNYEIRFHLYLLFAGKVEVLRALTDMHFIHLMRKIFQESKIRTKKTGMSRIRLYHIPSSVPALIQVFWTR